MLDALIIFCGEYLIYAVAAAAAAYFAWSYRTSGAEPILAALAALALAYSAARALGLFVSHEQPFFAHGYEPLIPHGVDNSFPSDHAAMAGALAGVASLYNRYAGLALWALAVMVAAGRMLAGLHYPVDVVIGLVLGGLCAAAAYMGVRFARRFLRK